MNSNQATNSLLIGMPYDNPSTHYINNVQTGALAACRRRNCHLIVEKIDLTAGDVPDAVGRLVTASRLDGVVLTPPVCDHAEILEVLLKTRIPFVCIAPDQATPKTPLSVQIDDYKAAYELTRYLASLGHQRIGFIKGHPRFIVSEQRYQGYCAALRDSGLKVDDEIVKQGYFSHRSGIICGEALLHEARLRPSAIFCSNDDMAAAVIEVAHKLDIPVPGSVSVAGFDDTAIASLTWPPLTTVRQPIVQMAETAIELLIRHLAPGQTEESENRVKLDFEIIIRKSTANPSK
jgi:LacI family transcriptional regulator